MIDIVLAYVGVALVVGTIVAGLDAYLIARHGGHVFHEDASDTDRPLHIGYGLTIGAMWPVFVLTAVLLGAIALVVLGLFLVLSPLILAVELGIRFGDRA